ncbi:endonuclease III domain-containing protein [Parvularcula marina]|uniref:HhH-GPD domain-containing protein n=1 Tax=Parvularcula marina TaxID=2292771 RepID=A0A371RF05_9PROT|nr:hypothetical protein [Parvularcula marina]RFB04038.1 hypothetical protein DX908_01315 [Parvularcula marina]
MQTSLTFTQNADLPVILDRLERSYGRATRHKRDAMRQLIFMVVAQGAAPSVGLAVFDRLQAVYPSWARLRDAEPRDLEALFIGLPDREKKARAIPEILKAIEAEHGELDLDHLAEMSTDAARIWLAALPGVSLSVASAVLAFSTLERPSLAVDRENVRPMRRLGLCPQGTPLSAVPREVMEGAPADWSGAQMASLSHGLGRLAATVCQRGKPACQRCPLMTLCPSSGHVAEVLAFPSAEARQAWAAKRSA